MTIEVSASVPLESAKARLSAMFAHYKGQLGWVQASDGLRLCLMGHYGIVRVLGRVVAPR